jgi:hypothetical protein
MELMQRSMEETIRMLQEELFELRRQEEVRKTSAPVEKRIRIEWGE